MKSTAYAFLSICLAAIVCNYVFAFLAFIVGVIAPYLSGNLFGDPNPPAPVELIMLFLPALLTGVLLSRVKPFFMPMVTAPLGVAIFAGVIALLDNGPPVWVRVGIVAAMSTLAVLGCIAGRRLPGRSVGRCAT